MSSDFTQRRFVNMRTIFARSGPVRPPKKPAGSGIVNFRFPDIYHKPEANTCATGSSADPLFLRIHQDKGHSVVIGHHMLGSAAQSRGRAHPSGNSGKRKAGLSSGNVDPAWCERCLKEVLFTGDTESGKQRVPARRTSERQPD